MLHELASVAGEDAETLTNRINTREAEMNARARELKDLERELKQRDRALILRDADLQDREKEVAAREQNVAVVEQRLGQRLRARMQNELAGQPKRKLGRNDQCWCKSGMKYKNCHLASDQSR